MTDCKFSGCNNKADTNSLKGKWCGNHREDTPPGYSRCVEGFDTINACGCLISETTKYCEEHQAAHIVNPNAPNADWEAILSIPLNSPANGRCLNLTSYLNCVTKVTGHRAVLGMIGESTKNKYFFISQSGKAYEKYLSKTCCTKENCTCFEDKYPQKIPNEATIYMNTPGRFDAQAGQTLVDLNIPLNESHKVIWYLCKCSTYKEDQYVIISPNGSVYIPHKF